MEVLGCTNNAIMSVAASATCPSDFGSLDTAGSVTLWDMRLKQKDHISIEVDPTITNKGDPTELLLAKDQHLAFVLAGEWIISYDLRQRAQLNSHKHTCEFAAFLAGAHPEGEGTTLVVDENGTIIPFSVSDCAPTAQLPAQFPAEGQPSDVRPFGSLSNWCCGLGFVKRQRVGHSSLLCAIGMDGRGAIYASPGRQLGSFDLLGDTWLSLCHGETINPPLVSSCSFGDRYVAIGRANGMYSIATVTEECDSVVEIFASPGHAQNNLSVVDWTGGSRPRLVTCSVCGEVSVWDVLPLLEVEEVDHGSDIVEGDPPSLDMSGSVRETTGQMVSVNCGVVVGGNQLLVGDTMGFVTACTVV